MKGLIPKWINGVWLDTKGHFLEDLVIYLSYCSVGLIFLMHCCENVFFSEAYVGWIKMKTCSSTKFSQPIGQYISHSYWKQLYCLKLEFCSIFFKFSSSNSRINCKICSKLTIETPDVVLVYLLLTSNIFDVLFQFFCWLWRPKCQMEYFIVLI